MSFNSERELVGDSQSSQRMHAYKTELLAAKDITIASWRIGCHTKVSKNSQNLLFMNSMVYLGK